MTTTLARPRLVSSITECPSKITALAIGLESRIDWRVSNQEVVAHSEARLHAKLPLCKPELSYPMIITGYLTLPRRWRL